VTVIFVSPATDPTERALQGVALAAHAAAPAGLQTSTLSGGSASRAAVDAAIQGADVVYYGHGYRDRLGDQVALIDAHNIGNCQGRIVVGMACSSLAGLGQTAIALGVAAYLGFTRPVVVPLAGGPWSIGPWSSAATSLLAGGAVRDALDQTQIDFDADADRIINNPGSAGYAQAVLDGNVQAGVGAAFGFEGDRFAKL
jgi:hypothetical protein